MGLKDYERYIYDLNEYLDAMTTMVDAARGNTKLCTRIAALRGTTGRPPEEAASYLPKADELERGLEG